jgi:hyperosmotically inducible protein
MSKRFIFLKGKHHMNKKIQNLSLTFLSFSFLSSLSAFGATRPDNTAINQRDKNESAITADQQKNDKLDVEITRRIRRDLTRNSQLSVYAHNIKIITIDGVVTLKGPVRNEDEKSYILKKAQAEAGAKNVRNQIEIASR